MIELVRGQGYMTVDQIPTQLIVERAQAKHALTAVIEIAPGMVGRVLPGAEESAELLLVLVADRCFPPVLN